jgi:branched-chain amino acid transport system substrate-binding protein
MCRGAVVGKTFARAQQAEAVNREVGLMLSRRFLLIHLLTTALVGTLAMRAGSAVAADTTVTIGINLSFTGANAHAAELIKDGALLAIDEANAQGGVAGYKIEVMLLDDGTATAGEYDPARAATNARKMVADKGVVAAIGPQMSGSGKASRISLTSRIP